MESSSSFKDAANAFHALITDYYEYRGYKYPDTWRALGFMNTELAEAYEVLLAEDGDWVRNNPDSKPSYSAALFGEELGDAIMMAMVAGFTRGVNPLALLAEKLQRKMGMPIADTRGGEHVHTVGGVDSG